MERQKCISVINVVEPPPPLFHCSDARSTVNDYRYGVNIHEYILLPPPPPILSVERVYLPVTRRGLCSDVRAWEMVLTSPTGVNPKKGGLFFGMLETLKVVPRAQENGFPPIHTPPIYARQNHGTYHGNNSTLGRYAILLCVYRSTASLQITRKSWSKGRGLPGMSSARVIAKTEAGNTKRERWVMRHDVVGTTRKQGA